MSRAKPRLTPTGQIEFEGVLYRLVDADDSYSVVRESDGIEMGSFSVAELGKSPGKSALEPGALEPELVLAIARLLSVPRGLLPIQ